MDDPVSSEVIDETSKSCSRVGMLLQSAGIMYIRQKKNDLQTHFQCAKKKGLLKKNSRTKMRKGWN
jgi:hypothetical protein